jgi:hypothetical protein
VLFSPPDDGWVDAGDGVQCAAIGRALDWPICRETPGMRWEMVANAAGDTIACPIVLRQDGGRAFVCQIGPDYLPVMSEQQARLYETATAARDTLETAVDADNSIPADAAARWAVQFLTAANHISEEALLHLGLLDEVLVFNALTKATVHGG